MIAARSLKKSDDDTLDKLTAAIDADQLELVMGDFDDALNDVAVAGGAAALMQIAIEDEGITDLVNERAVAWAKERAAELVGKRITRDGDVIDNPRAGYAIDDATRELLRADVGQAMQEGWSNDRLADSIASNYAFSDERAETIARTETAFADVQGNLIAYSESGLVQSKQWIVGDGCCDDCQELDGVTVALDDDFPGDGGDGPPMHPNCRCDVIPVLDTGD